MFKEFVYIDSSQDEELQQKKREIARKKTVEIVGGEERIQEWGGYRRCPAHNPSADLLQESEYEHLVKKLIRQKVDKQMIKTLMTNIEDVAKVQNIIKRNTNYQYFIQKMQIDQKYRAIQDQKSDKLKKTNQQKKKVLYRQQSKNELKNQQNNLKKFIVDKNCKEQLVVKHIREQIKKLGFERIYNAHKKIKEEIKRNKIIRENQLASELGKQRDELLLLQEEFEGIKEAKRINKMEQRKIIKALTQQIENDRKGLAGKFGPKKKFQV